MLRFVGGQDLSLKWAQGILSRPDEFSVGLVHGGHDDGIGALSAQLYAQSNRSIQERTAYFESFFEKGEGFTRAFERLTLKIVDFGAIFHEGPSDGADRLRQAILSRNISHLIVENAELVDAREWHRLAICRNRLLKEGRGLSIVIFGAGGNEDVLLDKMAPLSEVLQKFKLDILARPR